MFVEMLCEYYDELEKQGKIIKDGYSKIKVDYSICLSADGEIDNIIDLRKEEIIKNKNGKEKIIKTPKEILVPYRTQKSVISSNIIEERAAYIFGLKNDDGVLISDDKSFRKKNKAFKEKHLEFIKDLDSPIINAFKNFLNNWNPNEQVNNTYIQLIKKDLEKLKFAFCLAENPNILLHEDPQIKEKWEKIFSEKVEDENAVIREDAIDGTKQPIARIHEKIKGLPGASATGSVLIGFKHECGCSYGNTQSYNSDISEKNMKKYTYVLNYILSHKENYQIINGNTTLLFWSINTDKRTECINLFNQLLFGSTEEINEKDVEKSIKSITGLINSGKINEEKISFENKIDENIKFYIVGLKPNASRIIVKFIYKNQFGEIIKNIAKHQKDLQIGDRKKIISIRSIYNELKSPVSDHETVDNAMANQMINAIINNKPYPAKLLALVINRIKADKNVNYIKTGIIKAYLIRKKGEEILLSLDINNTNQAYLCGRLFAVLEKIQLNSMNKVASDGKTKTIKDTYFSNAISQPALIFPRIQKLSQYHLAKLDKSKNIFYNKLIQEIIDKIEGKFPNHLSLEEQGMFIIGYYHQYQSFFNKKEEKKEKEEIM